MDLVGAQASSEWALIGGSKEQMGTSRLAV